MCATAFEVAGVHLHFAGEQGDIETLKRLFEKFPTPRRLRPDVALVLDQNQCSWKTEQSSGSIRLLDPQAKTAAATMLLARLLSEARPDFVVLHGNGLGHPDAPPVLILGDSGAGKTTLTRQLLSPAFGYAQIAEDVLVLDPASGLLHPFPRALAIRKGEEAAAGTEATFGFADETRRGRPLEAFSAEAQPTPLAGSAVFLLSMAMPSTVAALPHTSRAPGRERAWISWADAQTLPALRQAGLPVADLRIGASVAEVYYDRPLSNEERGLQHRLFDALEILHLHSAPVAGAANGAENLVESEGGGAHARRPESPLCESLGPGDGVRGCLTHLRRVAGADSQGEASRVFLRLARALSSSRFFRLVPGGTPHETACLLARLAAREPSPV